MKKILIILLAIGWGITIYSIFQLKFYAQYPVVKTVYNNKILVSVLVEDEIKQIFDEIKNTGYEIRDVKTIRPVELGKFSWHNYGLAVDINPAQNPCSDCGDEISKNFRGVWIAGKNGGITKEVVDIFKKYGWCWGGDWCGRKDYMHFSKPVGEANIHQPHQDECAIAKCPYFN